MNFTSSYGPNRDLTQTVNYNNSVAFLQEDDNNNTESVNLMDSLDNIDIATILARQLNKVTASGVSWAETIKQLDSTDAGVTNINNMTATTNTTVNQQIHQIVVTNHEEEFPPLPQEKALPRTNQPSNKANIPISTVQTTVQQSKDTHHYRNS